MKSLESSKLFGIRKAVPKAPSSAVSGGAHEGPDAEVSRALLEAERKKAGAITILRRYAIR
jgi:hypothetical protein